MTVATHGAGTPVRISADCGDLVGKRNTGICAFKGIPYAEPPVGGLRWKAPRRLKRWSGRLVATQFGPAPMQELPARSSLMYRLNNDDAKALVMSEDCLYLNVWTPQPTPESQLPVMVWIHGGAFRSGHGGQDLFEGSRLASRGVVIVTLNMRLGALGFMALPELARENDWGASGNYGLMDVVAALGWVQDNIAAFGGDASRVTLAGNSAGAAAVNHLMAAPGARGLFSAAIGQSLSGMFRHDGPMLSQHDAQRRGVAAANALTMSLSQLRDQPATAFLRMPSTGPVIDGLLLREDTTSVFRSGEQTRIPLLAGWNADEASVVASPAALAELLLPQSVHAREALEQLYPQAHTPEAHAARRALIGDRRFVYPVWRWAHTHAETSQAPVWLYEFNHSLPLPDDVQRPLDGGAVHGAFHTAELPYTWGNLGARPWAWKRSDQQLSSQMTEHWMRFVTHHNPNGSVASQHWHAFNATHSKHPKVFGQANSSAHARRLQAFELFDESFFCTVPQST